MNERTENVNILKELPVLLKGVGNAESYEGILERLNVMIDQLDREAQRLWFKQHHLNEATDIVEIIRIKTEIYMIDSVITALGSAVGLDEN